MRRKRSPKSLSWIIETTADGEATVLRNGRQVQSGVSMQMALRYVRRRRREGEKVHRRDSDGYHSDITREV